MAATDMNMSAVRPPSHLPLFFPSLIQSFYVMSLIMCHQVSADSHSYDVTVAASDTDGNGHTNHVSYIQFCCNAAQVAVKAGTLHGYQTDIARYPLLVSVCVCVCVCVYVCVCVCMCVCVCV